MSTLKPDLPLRFRVNNQNLECFMGGNYVPLGADYNRSSEAIQSISDRLRNIPWYYRDLEDVANGSHHFISPFYKYFGFNKTSPYSYDIGAQYVQHYRPITALRFTRKGVAMDNITIRDYLDSKNGNANPNFLTEYMYPTSHSSSYTAIDKYTGDTLKVVTPVDRKIDWQLQWYPVITTSILNVDSGVDYGFGKVPEGEGTTEVIMVIINWKDVPDGAYFRYGFPQNRGQISAVPDKLKIKYILENTEAFRPNTPDILRPYLNNVKELESDQKGAWKVKGEDIKFVGNEDCEVFHKIERPEAPYTQTLLVAEYTLESGTTYWSNSMVGLCFNMYVKDSDWEWCTRDLYNDELYYINDYSKLGTLFNHMERGTFMNYAYFPTFIKRGNRLNIITATGRPVDVEQYQMEKYLFYGMTGNSLVYSSRRLASTTPNKKALDIFLGKQKPDDTRTLDLFSYCRKLIY